MGRLFSVNKTGLLRNGRSAKKGEGEKRENQGRGFLALFLHPDLPIFSYKSNRDQADQLNEPSACFSILKHASASSASPRPPRVLETPV